MHETSCIYTEFEQRRLASLPQMRHHRNGCRCDSGRESLSLRISGLPLCDLGAEFTLVCNDEGKLLELPPNRMLWGGADYLAGSGFIAGTDSEGNMTSLTAEEIAYYTEKYRAFLIAL